jgi:hypothetical protein
MPCSSRVLLAMRLLSDGLFEYPGVLSMKTLREN